ncbi:MAG: hypothetical protein U5M53_03730 [Rhodoferax sp.]|nr:hypothetical protein [Rhodoferax sp.]
MAALRSTSLAVCLVLGASANWAAPVGTVLFSQAGSHVVDAQGQRRDVRRGDVLQPGDRLVTPDGGISQVLMPDGSVLGVRPGTELRFDPPAANAPSAPPIVALLRGTIRVIGADLPDIGKTSGLTLLSGQAILQLRGADLESTVVGDKGASGTDPGSYNRLLAGNANIGKGSIVEPLAVRQVSFVGGTNLAPVRLASVSPDVFGKPAPLPSGTLGGAKTIVLGLSSPSLTTTLSNRNLAPLPSATGAAPTVTQPPPTKLVVVLPPAPVIRTTPVIITPPVVIPPKLPVVSCKILRTC